MIKLINGKEGHNFMRLWWAQLISQFGDRIHQMALIGLIAQREPGSALGLAKLLSFTIIPVFIVGPIAGVFVDRWDRRRTLLFCDIIRACLVLTIPFIFIYSRSIVPIYCIVFLIFCCSRFYVPAKMSIIPDLVPKEKLLMANSLISTTGMIAFGLGCALGGFIVEWQGVRAGFLWDAATFFISGMLIMSIRKDFRLNLDRSKIVRKGKEFLKIERSVLSEIKEGLQYLIRNREIRFVISMLSILLAAAGAIYVVIIIFIQQTFHSVTKDLSVLAVFLAVGLFLGVLAYGKWGKKFAWYKIVFFCLVFGGMMLLSFAILVHDHPNIFLAAALVSILGLVIGPIFIASNTVVHLVSDEKMRGKVFSALEIVIHFAFLVAMLVSSFLSEYIARLWILVGVGVIFMVVGIAGLIRYRNGHDLAGAKLGA